MERIPTPTFDLPVLWLRVGDMQLHLFLDDGPAPSRHHLGITIDDFDAAYEAVKARASDTWGYKLVELPSRPAAALLPRPERQPDRAQLCGPTASTGHAIPSCGGSPITSRRSPTRRKPSSTSPPASDGRSTAAARHPEEAAHTHCRATAHAAHRRLGAARGARGAPGPLGALLRADNRKVCDELRLGGPRPEGLPHHGPQRRHRRGPLLRRRERLHAHLRPDARRQHGARRVLPARRLHRAEAAARHGRPGRLVRAHELPGQPDALDRPGDRRDARGRRRSASRCSSSSCAGTRDRTCARR